MNLNSKTPVALLLALSAVAVGFAVYQRSEVTRLQAKWRDRKGYQQRADQLELQLNELRAEVNRLERDAQTRQPANTLAIEIPNQRKVPQGHSSTSVVVAGKIVALDGSPEKLIEISIGSDVGILSGHQLEVVRRTGDSLRRLGRIEVVRSYPDGAVARRLSGWENQVLMRDDEVVTELR